MQLGQKPGEVIGGWWLNRPVHCASCIFQNMAAHQLAYMITRKDSNHQYQYHHLHDIMFGSCSNVSITHIKWACAQVTARWGTVALALHRSIQEQLAHILDSQVCDSKCYTLYGRPGSYFRLPRWSEERTSGSSMALSMRMGWHGSKATVSAFEAWWVKVEGNKWTNACSSSHFSA